MRERKRQALKPQHVLHSDKPVALPHIMQHVREGVKLLPAAVISGALNGPAK